MNTASGETVRNWRLNVNCGLAAVIAINLVDQENYYFVLEQLVIICDHVTTYY